MPHNFKCHTKYANATSAKFALHSAVPLPPSPTIRTCPLDVLPNVLATLDKMPEILNTFSRFVGALLPLAALNTCSLLEHSFVSLALLYLCRSGLGCLTNHGKLIMYAVQRLHFYAHFYLRRRGSLINEHINL